MNDTPKKGDRVRVVLEGEVGAVNVGLVESRFLIGSPPNKNIISPDAEHVVSVEVLGEEFEMGDFLWHATAVEPANALIFRHEDGLWRYAKPVPAYHITTWTDDDARSFIADGNWVREREWSR